MKKSGSAEMSATKRSANCRLFPKFDEIRNVLTNFRKNLRSHADRSIMCLHYERRPGMRLHDTGTLFLFHNAV